MATNTTRRKHKSSYHGGARKGAGRKPAGTVPMLIRPLHATAQELRAQARRQAQTLGQVIDALIAHAAQ